jgi:hypothetical protein
MNPSKIGSLAAVCTLLVILTGAAAGAETNVPAADAAAKSSASRPNLVPDPGFEAGKGWKLNNWYVGPHGEKGEAEAALDTDHPHSGKYCQRMTVTKRVGQDMQLIGGLPTLRAGAGYELRFWVRGVANSRPFQVLLMNGSAGYAKYLRGDVSVSGEWSEVVMRAVLPPNAAVNGIAIWICMYDVGTIWIDDVSLTEMPAAEEGEPLKGNLVANGSFEAGHDKWYAYLPGGGYEKTADAREEKIAKGTLDFGIVDMPDAPSGQKVLHWKQNKVVSLDLTSAKFRLRYGHPVTVSFSARCSPAPAPRLLRFRLGSGEFGGVVTHGKEQQIDIQDDQWHRYSFTMTPTPSADSRYFLEFNPPTQEGTDFYLDAVTVTEGDTAPAPTPEFFQDAGWARVDDAHPGNIYSQNEKVSFRILASGLPTQSEVRLRGRVVDSWERPVADMQLSVPLSRGAGESVISLPSAKFGAFKCELYREGQNEMPAVEVVYHVLPHLTPLKEVKDSFFGGHVDMTPYNLAIAEKVGFRWLRYHGPADTKWLAVQPHAPTADNDGFVFHRENTNWIAGTKRAYDMGFKLFGTFGKLPAWAEDKPAKTPSPAGLASYPPKDYEAWDKYVVETAKAFSPYITTWETWNEPDAGFLKFAPESKDKPDEVVIKLAQRSRAALDKAGLKVTLIGPALCGVSRPLSRAVMKQNIMQDLDYMSFHCYGSGNLTAFLNECPTWADLKDHSGGPLQYWQSEGGITSADIHTWLKTSGNVISDPNQMARDAAATTQLLVQLRAIGVKKSFHYQADAQPSGRLVYRNEWFNMIDVNGIPFATLPAHAAAVYFLEDVEPVGLTKDVAVGNTTATVCRFTHNGKKLEVVWCASPVGLDRVIQAVGGARQAFDVMANPLPVEAATLVSFSPVYLVE